MVQYPAPPAGACESDPNLHSKYRVIIVDDNEDAAEVLAMLLDSTGFASRVVNDSRLAMDRILKFRPHFVLLDLAMPGVSGFELCRQIRLEPGLANTAVIALSGYADRTHEALAMDAGCDHHLVKPFELKAFHRILDREIERRAPGDDGFFVRL